jgi:MFS family permease
VSAPERGVDKPSTTFHCGGPYAWYVLTVLFLVYALSLIDRQILSILAEDVKRDLHLTDAQLGYLYGTAFAIFYTVFGIPLGRLADNWRRIRLMALGLALWSLMTTLSGLASSYAILAIARIGVGVGEASVSPAAYSILAATFPQRRRALAISIYTAGAYVGIGLSLPLGGWLSSSWDSAFASGPAPFGLEGWQAAFITVGAPGLLVALWVLSLREPPRFAENGAALPVVRPGVWRTFFIDVAAILPPFSVFAAARVRGGLLRNLKVAGLVASIAGVLIWLTGDVGQWVTYGIGVYAIASWAQSLRFTDPPAYRLFWGTPIMPLCILGIGCAGLVLNIFALWASPYAIRTFGVSAAEVGPLIGIPGAIAAALGSVAGGYLADRWKQGDPRGRVFVCMLGPALSIPLILLMFTRTDFQTYLLISPLIYFTASFLPAAAVTTLQDFVLPRMYATAGAMWLIGQTMIGLSLGPYATGKVATLTGSLQLGVFSALIAPAAAFVILWFVSRHAAAIERDKLDWAIDAGEPPDEHRAAVVTASSQTLDPNT